MKTRSSLVNETISEFDELVEHEWLKASQDDIYQLMHEVVDSNIPIYSSDTLDIAISSLWLAYATPATVVVSEDINPISLINLNIYELLLDKLRTHIQKLESKQ